MVVVLLLLSLIVVLWLLNMGKLHGVVCVILLSLVGVADPVSGGVDEAAECSSVPIWVPFGLSLLFVAGGGFPF